MHRSPSFRSGEVFSRVVLPLVLFVAVVGGIAWVTQYLPNGPRSPRSVEETPNAEPLLKFSTEQALFDKDDPDYGQEIETNEEGHYDFAFENISGKELELGLQFKNCGCTQVEAKVGYEPFKPMVPSDKEKIAKSSARLERGGAFQLEGQASRAEPAALGQRVVSGQGRGQDS